MPLALLFKLKIAWAIWGFLWFWFLGLFELFLAKKSAGEILIGRDYIEHIDCLGLYAYFHNANFSNPWTWDIFLFFVST
jgi:hypothetical protein